MDASKIIELVSRRRGPPRAYAVAGVTLVTDVEHQALATYALDEPAVWKSPLTPPAPDPATVVTFDGQGLIGDGSHHVVCREGTAGYELQVHGLGVYHIGRDGRVFETTAETNVAPDLRGGTILGAPLVLALALRGIFCIHASVAALGGKVLAFIGESGQGKSTLARYLDDTGGPDWRRIIDDTLPIAPANDNAAEVLPHFPQLKLASEVQPSQLVPERMPLRSVYVLENGGEVRIAPMHYSEAALALAAHTVGGRLFGRDLLAAHLTFCGELAGRVPVRRLAYPRSFDVLSAVRDTLTADLG